ncbi:MAG: hypothetical protein GF313_06640, partial [Caldithrix sp.]|nr:hypothetical protein [Caldithrix sp.]
MYPEHLPEDLWLSESSNSRVDSFFAYAQEAQVHLKSGDTLGAEIYFDLAFETMSHFNEEEQNTLLRWQDYDSVFKVIDTQYRQIYASDYGALEAEEVRQAISELERLNLADSVLYGSQSTIIDSSTGIPLTLNRRV